MKKLKKNSSLLEPTSKDLGSRKEMTRGKGETAIGRTSFYGTNEKF